MIITLSTPRRARDGPFVIESMTDSMFPLPYKVSLRHSLPVIRRHYSWGAMVVPLMGVAFCHINHGQEYSLPFADITHVHHFGLSPYHLLRLVIPL